MKEVYKIDKQMVLEKCGTADRSPAAVTIEERIGCMDTSVGNGAGLW